MNRRMLMLTLLAAVLVVAPVTTSEIATPVAGATTALHARVSRIRVCPYELFSRAHNACTRDARNVQMSTNRFTCSALVGVDRPATVRIRVTYDGGPVTGWHGVAVPGGATTPVWFSYSIGTNLPLPAGAWSCTFLVGAVRSAVPFRTRGPVGDVVDLTVCAGFHTIGSYKNGICREDESMTGVPPTALVVCSLYVLHKVGSTPRIEIVDGAGGVVSSYTGGPIKETIWPVWAWASSPNGSNFAPDEYACRVSLDGQVTVTRDFAIAG